MTEAAIVALIGLAVKYGPDVAIAFAKLFKGGATVDDAIAALSSIPTAQSYLDAAGGPSYAPTDGLTVANLDPQPAGSVTVEVPQ